MIVEVSVRFGSRSSAVYTARMRDRLFWRLLQALEWVCRDQTVRSDGAWLLSPDNVEWSVSHEA